MVDVVNRSTDQRAALRLLNTLYIVYEIIVLITRVPTFVEERLEETRAVFKRGRLPPLAGRCEYFTESRFACTVTVDRYVRFSGGDYRPPGVVVYRVVVAVLD